MRKTEKKYPGSLLMTTLLLAGGIFGAWLIGMFCLTSVTAEAAADYYLRANSDRASTIFQRDLTNWDREDLDQKYQNYTKNLFWTAVDNGTFSRGWPVANGDSGFIELRSSQWEAWSATAIYDPKGNCIAKSWEDFFYFEAMTEEQWAARQERSHHNARAFFDRTKLTEQGLEMVQDGWLSYSDARLLRFTGSFDGVDLTPTKIEYIDEEEFSVILHEHVFGYYTASGVVQDYDLQWRTIYEDPAAVEEGTEQVVLYSDWFDVCFQQHSPSFTYRGEKYVEQPGTRHRGDWLPGTGPYSGIDALVEELGPSLAAGSQNLHRYEGLDLLIVDVAYSMTHDGENYLYSNYAGKDGYQGEAPEVNFYVVSGVYCSPWRTAMRQLCHVYLWTFGLALVLLLAVRSKLRRELVEPVAEVCAAMEKDGAALYRPGEPPRWRESQALQRGYGSMLDRQRMQQNEITRLNTALDYAKNAEENRRQMTSNIAHELKTPLAVVHSYAEGLQERIAEEKREKYLQVILSETERMDDMVLEMLELSRLEAGKVKLNREEFSLSALAEEVFARLSVAAEARELQVSFHWEGDCTVTADRDRIEQVVTNFATNAIKYATSGGQVRVLTRQWSNKTELIVENDCEPLTEEALSKVWDTFYREEKSRSGEGTGLGLAIARSIVELHGGVCAVRNIKGGVAFSFRI